MIKIIINEMMTLISNLENAINQDIEDIKNANNEELLNRNDLKQVFINQIILLKQKLNKEIAKQMQEGININIFKNDINNLETKLKSLYELNHTLASIVLPLKQMYQEIVHDITQNNGGSLINVKA